jgi:hypothetical protein
MILASVGSLRKYKKYATVEHVYVKIAPSMELQMELESRHMR